MNQPTPTFVKAKFDVHLWWVTALLIAINVGLFAWQVLQGMDVSNPSIQDALKWGADYAPLSFLAEPERLFSSMFFHFGLIHLTLNMWALYLFGSIAEQMFGRFYFLSLYILAGLMGSLLSGYISIYNSQKLLASGQLIESLLPSVGAGASGAVMGLGAALTVLALFPMLPKQRFILDKKTLVLVLALNLSMGFMIPGINNAAHIGGMLMGILMTLIWYIGQRLEQTKLFNFFGVLSAILACGLLYMYCLNQLSEIYPLWQALVERITQ